MRISETEAKVDARNRLFRFVKSTRSHNMRLHSLVITHSVTSSIWVMYNSDAVVSLGTYSIGDLNQVKIALLTSEISVKHRAGQVKTHV